MTEGAAVTSHGRLPSGTNPPCAGASGRPERCASPSRTCAHTTSPRLRTHAPASTSTSSPGSTGSDAFGGASWNAPCASASTQPSTRWA